MQLVGASAGGAGCIFLGVFGWKWEVEGGVTIKMGGSWLFGVKEQVGRCAFEGAAETRLADRGIVEGIPAVVEGIAAVSSVVPEVDVPRMVDHTYKFVGGVADAGVLREGDESGEVEGLADLEAVVELLLAVLAEGEAFDLQHQHAGQPVEVQLPSAFPESSIRQEVPLHLEQ